MEEVKLQEQNSEASQNLSPEATTASTPLAKSHVKFKKLILIICGSTIGILLVFIGFFVLLSKTTLLWKTYSNPQYGFSFKYPPYWQIAEGSFENGYSITFDEFGIETLGGHTFDINLFNTQSTYYQFHQKHLEDIVENKVQNKNESYTNIKQLTTDGRQLYSYRVRLAIVPPGGFVPFRAGGTVDGTFYDIGFNHSILFWDEIIFDQILSTFKFTD